MTITPAHEHQLTQRTRFEQFVRLAQRRMITMIETHAHLHACTLRGFDDWLQFTGAACGRLFETIFVCNGRKPLPGTAQHNSV